MADIPSRIGKFELGRLLGRGAMGEVYLATDTVIGRQVALKIIRPALMGLDPGDELLGRFQREARSAGILSHPHIVTVYEFGEDQGLFFLAMEYVNGEDFATLLAEKSLSPSDILEVVAQVCEGLQQAHKNGILHRDIKPSNVMVVRDEGQVRAKLMDFGVAKATGAAATQTGQVVGTLAYMAPEYLRSGQADPVTDLFSVGVMLHEALAGERPFGGSTTGAVVYGIIHDPPRPLDPANIQGLSPSILSITAGLLEKDPVHRRPNNAGELGRWLRAAKDPHWRPALSDQATTALDKKSLSAFTQGRDVVSAAATTAGHRAKEAEVTTGGQRARVRKRHVALWILSVLGASAILVMLTRRGTAMPAVVAPTGDNMHVNDVALEEAVQIAAKGHPEEALKLAQAVIDATPKTMPVDPDAYAVKLLALYKEGRIVEFAETLAEARFRGVSAKDLLTNAAYKDMLEKDKAKKKLPETLRNRLLQGQDADASS